MDDVEKVKQKLDIVDIIGERLQLKKAGRNFKANCPFHNEKSPSFVVSAERQIWHCFGCQKGGDMFTFIEDYENVTFSEALKELAAKAGVKLTASPARSDRERKQELIYSLNHLSAQYYNWLLLSHPVGKNALEYLTEKRKLTIPLIKTFMLGFAPNNDGLVKYLIGKKKYGESELYLAGLAFQKGRYASDFFKNRIIFPIIDHRGNTVAFSGRAIDDTLPKYVNTRETPVYIKGDTLFGLNLAREGIKSEGKVIIVEGEFDVISAHKEGIANIVAVKGTALTENQIKLLKRFSKKLAFCFDTDPAGTDAQRRSIQMIEQEGITATVIIPPQGKDPDELLNENPHLFKKAVKNDVNVFDFVIDSALVGVDTKSAEGKKQVLEKTLPYLSVIENEVIKEHYLKVLAGKIDSSLESLLKQADKSNRGKPALKPAEKRAQLPHEEVLEIYLLSLIFQSQDPKNSLAIVRKTLSGIPLSVTSLEKVLLHLDKYQQMEPAFSPHDFVAKLPAELHVAFDTSYLAPLPESLDPSKMSNELEKTAKQVRMNSVKNRLGMLASLIKQAEGEKNSEMAEKYEAEFGKLSRLLST